MASQPRILVIGCGGTGVEALLELQALFNQYPGKRPPHVSFLCVDTVAARSRGNLRLSDEECVLLRLRDPVEMLRNPDNGNVREWFPGNIKVQTAVQGAAQIRPLGRLALHAEPQRFVARLIHCLDALTDRARLRETEEGESIDEQGSIEVYILASLCGGTGSGIAFDVAQLVREQLKDAPTLRVAGIFLLPGPFQSKAGTGLVTANAYAALKELDYLAAPQDPVDFRFGSRRKLVLERSPFDLVYLVDRVGERYDTTTNVQQLARQMAYLPYLMTMPSFGPYVREVLHNLLPQLEAKELVQGKRATYASFGVATLELSGSSVGASRQAFEMELLAKLLADEETVQPLGDLGADAALAKCNVEQFPEHLELLLLEFDFGDPNGPVDKLEEIYAAAAALVDDYAKTFTRPHVRALRESGERAMQRLIQDASTHPGGIFSALKECSEAQKLLKGMQGPLRAPSKTFANAEEERVRAWTLCRDAFKSRRRRKREPAAQEWQVIVNSQVLPARLIQAVNNETADAIGFLIDQAREAEQWCVTAIKNLENCLKHLSEKKVLPEAPPSPFTQYGDTESIRPHADARTFLAGLPGPKRWFEGPETSIRGAIAAFSEQEFVPAFSPEGTSSATRLLLADLERYITGLKRFSDPMWGYSPSKIPSDHHQGIHHLEVLGVNKLSGDTLAVSTEYPAVGLIQTGWPDRVVYLQIRAGIPLFALTCMDDLWRDYAQRSEGLGRKICHIDRRWTGWPELLPHAFNPAVISALVRGFLSSHIVRSATGTIEYSANSAKRKELGANFLQAYHALNADPQLVGALLHYGPAMENGTAGKKSAELWELLLHDRVAIEDRPLVEALLRSVQRIAQDGPFAMQHE